MKQLSVISITVLTLLLLSTSAIAWNGCKTQRCYTDCSQTQQGNHIERMAVILDLSAEQQQQMAELRATQQQQRAQMRTELQELRQELRSTQTDVNVDNEDLKAKARTFADLKAAMLVNKIEHKQQMFNLLTPAQQEKAAKLKNLYPRSGNKGMRNKADACPKRGCRPECCPKSFSKGCNAQGQGAIICCGKQSPCMMRICR